MTIKEEVKYSYAVMRSGFGDLWVGKFAKLEPDEETIFANFDDAIEEAKKLNDSIENAEELDATFEEDLELLDKKMEKWIV